MIALNDKELQAIRGGISGWAIAGIAGGIAFLIGLLDGFVRPLKCR